MSSRPWMMAALTLLVGCDHVTKHAAKAALEQGTPHPLVRGLVDLRYVENRDVAFNLLRWVPEGVRAPALLLLGAMALLALFAALVRTEGARRAALLLISAGALGNYLDRLARGYVVDFVHLAHWPVFNVADAYVTAGAGLLLFAALREQRTRGVPG